jgi:Na+/melibiose symporter-like transporter
MKKLEKACITLGMVLAAVPAFAAVDTAKVYSSGILVLVFLGICALFVVSQMIPAIILLAGMIKGVVRNVIKGKMVPAESGEKDLH